VAVAVASFWPTLFNGYIWDDDFYIWNNPALDTAGGLAAIWLDPRATPQYYPLVHTSYWLEHRLWGDRPAGYHAVNLLLHAGSSLLLWRLLERLAVPGALFAALLFAVHPVGVESVAWATERKNTLSLCCGLAATLAWLEFLDRRDSAAGRGVRAYAAAIGLFVCALLAKTVTVTLVGALPVITWWHRGRLDRRDLWPLVPFLMVGLPLASATVWLEKHHVGASGTEWQLAPAERLLVAGRAIVFYAGKVLWPQPLVFFYPRWQLDATAAWQWLFPLAVAGVAAGLATVAARAGGRLGRGPLAVGLLFCGLLFPALGFFDVYPFRYSFVADHFQYHALPAAAAGIAAAATLACDRLAIGGKARFLLAGLVVTALGLVTFRYTQVFANEETLYRDVLAKNPTAWPARNNLGRFLTDADRLAEADTVYRELLARPDLPPWPRDRASFHHNFGNLLERQGRAAEAEREYRAAIAIDPTYPKPRNNLATLLADGGRRGESIAAYEALLALPLPAAARGQYLVNLATVRAEEPAWPEVERLCREAVLVDGRLAAAHEWLGIAVLRQGRVREAVPHFERAFAAAADPAARARAAANLTAARQAAGQTKNPTAPAR
jgi:tetratricopeptide (TPR) repeat protein